MPFRPQPISREERLCGLQIDSQDGERDSPWLQCTVSPLQLKYSENELKACVDNFFGYVGRVGGINKVQVSLFRVPL